MKRRVFGGFSALLLLMVLGAVSANAESTLNLNMHIPFDFYIGDRAMPAGDYTLETTGVGNQVIELRNVLGHTGASFLTSPTETRGKGHTNELVFRHYGTLYFLSAIWEAGNPIGRVTRGVSRREQEVRASLGRPVLRLLVASAR